MHCLVGLFANLCFHYITAAQLYLVINVSGEPHPLRDMITVDSGAEVTIECFGSGDLQWTSSTGQEVSTDMESSNLYQLFISSRDVQVLHIRNFSSSNAAATYTCTTNLTSESGDTVEIAVTLKEGSYVLSLCTLYSIAYKAIVH